MLLQRIAAVAALGVALTGCATIIEGSTQSIAVTTPPTSGAYCVLSSKEGNWTVLTPGIATVEKSNDDMAARCSKPGWQDASVTIPSDFEGWTVGNLIVGGVVGFGVDALTGAIHKYPHAFQIPMRPINGDAPPPSAPSTAPPGLSQNAPAAAQRQCTQDEETQKRVAIENGYSMIPNCQ